ncbi:MAG: hypothetical protein ACJAV7_002865 [Flavobacteriales bacterium]|jgi:hypothetical protein
MDMFLMNQRTFHDKVSLEELHKVSLFWKSTVAFWRLEMRFFQNFIDKYFMEVASPDYLGRTTKLVD